MMDAAALFVQPKAANKLPTLPAAQNDKERRCDFSKIASILAYVQQDYAAYKYTVYRCAVKFVQLKKLLYTANIPYKLVLALLERYGIRDVDVNLMVPPFQLTAFIHDMYYTADKLGHLRQWPTFRMETAAAVLASFFWNIFDPQHKHSISVLEIKVTLLLLCRLHVPNDLVTEFFNMLRDPKLKIVPKRNFEYVLNILAKVFTYIGETEAYGVQNVPIIMEQCNNRQNTYGFSENQFRNFWLSSHTRFIIYANLILLIKRIEDTEKLIHSNACAACHRDKIIGIRFKCDVCRNLSLCMKCFATGYAASKHEPGHRMCEMFSEDEQPKKLFSHFFAKMCKWPFKIHNSEETKGFCNTSEAVADDNELAAMSTVHVSTLPDSTATTETTGGRSSEIENSLAGLSNTASTASNVSERLQSIIDRLLQQNVKLEKQIKCVKASTAEELSEFLQAHQSFLIDIINEMRRISQISKSLHSCPTSSTPNRSVCDNVAAVAAAATVRAEVLSIAGSALTHSINGADLNRTYLEANKSDLSINDLSSWFNNRRIAAPLPAIKSNLAVLSEDAQFNSVTSVSSAESFEIVDIRDTEMMNFKILLSKVKEIVEDSYSENSELAAATQNLENVLDSIVRNEELRRLSRC